MNLLLMYTIINKNTFLPNIPIWHENASRQAKKMSNCEKQAL